MLSMRTLIVAILTLIMGIQGVASGQESTRKARVQLIVEKHQGKWKMRADHEHSDFMRYAKLAKDLYQKNFFDEAKLYYRKALENGEGQDRTVIYNQLLVMEIVQYRESSRKTGSRLRELVEEIRQFQRANPHCNNKRLSSHLDHYYNDIVRVEDSGLSK